LLLDSASKKASILTHHDAITGTHVLKVKEDYELIAEESETMLKKA